MKIKKLKNKKIILLIASVIVIVGVVGGLEKFHIINLYEKKPNLVANDPESDLNLSPPTDQEKQESDKAKEDQYKKDQERKSATPTSNVTPVITYAGQYNGMVEVSALVNGIFEEGGQCHITFTQNQSTIVRDTAGIKNVSNTSCQSVRIPDNQFSKGTWSVKVEYKSSVSNGTSKSVSFDVK